MKKLVFLVLIAVAYGCGDDEMPPPFDDSENIVIKGEKITAGDYKNLYCRGENEKYRDSPYCQRATQAAIRWASSSNNPDSPFYGAPEPKLMKGSSDKNEKTDNKKSGSTKLSDKK